MPTITNVARDQHGRVIAGATVVIRDATTGTLAASTTTDAVGAWSAVVVDGTYTVITKKGADFETRVRVVCADEPPNNERTVLDQRNRPVARAQVWIRQDGDLVELAEGNPVFTDSLGRWDADLEPGTYDLTIIKGDASTTRELYVCAGDEPPETFYILAETGDIIAAEDDDLLRKE